MNKGLGKVASLSPGNGQTDEHLSPKIVNSVSVSLGLRLERVPMMNRVMPVGSLSGSLVINELV